MESVINNNLTYEETKVLYALADNGTAEFLDDHEDDEFWRNKAKEIIKSGDYNKDYKGNMFLNEI